MANLGLQSKNLALEEIKIIVLHYKINFILCDTIKSSDMLTMLLEMYLVTLSVTQAISLHESKNRIRGDNKLQRFWKEVTVVSDICLEK